MPSDSSTSLPWEHIRPLIRRALEEDIGTGDISSQCVFPREVPGAAVILAKQAGVLAGLPVSGEVFRQLDADVVWIERAADGDEVSPGQAVAELRGRLLAILAGERVALNFLQRLSGIATLTRRFVRAVEGLPVQILDTRKTTPGLRVLEKYAVRVGGAGNHRFGLYDAILLKDNHIAAAGGVGRAVERAKLRAPRGMMIEVEAKSLQEVEEALRAGAERILLDNMTPAAIRQAVALVGGRAQTEVSGGVTLDVVRQIAETGVNFISVGALTHSAPALDLSLEVLRE